MVNEEGDREINEGEIASPVPGDLIDFNGKGEYSPPKLTWDETIACEKPFFNVFCRIRNFVLKTEIRS